MNRYLIWYWLRLELEHAESLEELLGTLGTKPVLEISGPRVITRDSRVLFDLDPIYYDTVEIGILSKGYRLERVGSRPGAKVSDLLEAVRTGEDGLFVRALRGGCTTASGRHVVTDMTAAVRTLDSRRP